MKKEILEKYAELLVKTGIALKPGQPVVVTANVDIEDFVAMVVEECYRDGASRVVVNWTSEAINRISLKEGKKEELARVLPFEEAMEAWKSDELPALLWLDSDDPDGMNGIDASKAAFIRKEKNKVLYPYRERRENKYSWLIAGVASKAWAKKVFPHDKNLKKKCEYLNSLRLKKLHYTSSNGTDLTVGLIPGVIFEGGGEMTLTNIYCQPNIPSEECFTSPMRGEAEGIVYSAKPLSYAGQLITDFWVKFEKGKAVDVGAKTGEEALRSILSLDEGSAYLGECALVPYDSPINNTGILFYNTLFDENAACHLALGRGFTNLYPDFEKYTEEELHSFGINKSSSHVDFMIGSKDLNIVGTTEDGREVAIFKDGNWAF